MQNLNLAFFLYITLFALRFANSYRILPNNFKFGTVESRDVVNYNTMDLVYNYTSGSKIQGVNLGGWLLLEPYITPNLFWNATDDPSNRDNEDEVPIDEYHYCEKLGKEEAEKRLQEHWSTWIVEEDIKNISDWGLNMLRIPIGYWHFAQLDDDPYVSGGEEYLDKAIEWARNYNLTVWIDLHGAPGSQNGFDNSGLRDHIGWLNSTTNVQLTYDILYYIMDKYGHEDYYDVICGIEILNEPIGPQINQKHLIDFNEKSYTQLRCLNSHQNFIFHDAFYVAGFWDDYLMNQVSKTDNYNNITIVSNSTADKLDISKNSTYYSGDYYNVVLDHHRYEVFDVNQLKESIDGHVQGVKEYGSNILKEKHLKIVGEWSAALTDCAYWLNGVGRGSRYEGTYDNDEAIGVCGDIENVDSLNNTMKKNIRTLIEAQLNEYNKTQGWIFWCYKTESTISWDMKRLVENDLFPQPLTQRKYLSSASKLLFNSLSLNLQITFFCLVFGLSIF
ncbi:hydrolase activity, acting on glycosyl bonds protein [[Candida] boidinii]|nr:hydrolase activity, acting on glycosyl bonds protein [[Candida] boidinii]